ncbi:MAG TPA: Nramp family divalent metal transporter, partial [Chloroflexota bacterium]|nr:Nramp family divalent metal transporter [Chloroflexota bacterium]
MRAAAEVLSGESRRGRLARIWPFLGPAFIACVAYVDPGNFATNIQGGAQFGYMLLWVVVASNLMAMLVQALSAKLGIATGRNLAELFRERYSRPVVIGMWLLMELVAMATDLAEFLGAAVGFQLLFHVPLIVGGLLTGIATFIILGLERHGFRPVEAVISALVGIIAIAYVAETFLDRPSWSQIAYHSVVPQLFGKGSVFLATGILGATVMPHVIFLHSALTQGRIVTREPDKMRRLYRFELADVLIAMGLAGFVNAAMLIMAAATFHQHGHAEVGEIEEAFKTLKPLLGSAASWIFAVSLLASGLSSSTVGTMAGQIMMQGFVHRQIPVWLRRAVTMAPSLVVIALGVSPTDAITYSQVILSFGLPFALIPLLVFTRRRETMGVLTNHRLTTAVAGVVTALIISL